MWSRVPRKVPGKFFRSGRITGNDNLEKNPTSESDFNKNSTRKSTSDPKILKLIDGWVNMFITMVLTIFLSRGTRIARSNLRRPPLDDFGSQTRAGGSKYKGNHHFPLRGIGPNSEVNFDTFFRLERAVRVPRCWEWILTIVTNILTQPSTNFKIFGCFEKLCFYSSLLARFPR